MFTHYRTKGFILKKIDRGEADQVLTVYTEKFGKLDIVARSSRKIKSKLRGNTDIFCISEIEFIQGKRNKTLTDAVLIKDFKEIKRYEERLKAAFKISEIISKLVKGQESDEKIWSLLDEVFEKLNNWTIGNSPIIYHYFLWNFLSILGYRAELYYCSLCQGKIVSEDIFLNIKEGGLICSSCQKELKETVKITPNAVKIARLLLKKEWPILKRLKIDEEDIQAVDFFSNHYLIEYTI